VPKRLSRKRPEPVQNKIVRSEAPETSSWIFLLLLILLAGSGCAALIYEIVWFQLLELVIGSSAISLALLLAVYMGGLCLGSAALPRLVSAHRQPLFVYASLELGIGAFGIIALYAVPWLGRWYLAGATTGSAGLVLRGIIAVVCLLPPTLLMGGSFPAISRWAESTSRGISRLGLLYSANIAGAVLGCVLAGFYLLRVYDLAVGTFVAAAINGIVAVLAFALAAWVQKPAAATDIQFEMPGRVKREPGAALVYVAIALSGLTALGAEVVWTRLLSLLLGATVYTFSIILAVFLLGLWAGSGAGSFLVRRVKNPRVALAACQALLALAIAFTAWTLTHWLPFWPVDPWLSTNPIYNFDLDVMRCLRTIFPATLLWGASFPLALAAVAAAGEDTGWLSGRIYAANTAGSIVGALAFSLILIPRLGTQGSQQLLIWIAATGSVMAALAMSTRGMRLRYAKTAAMIAGAVVLAWGLALTVSEVPWQVIAYGRRVAPILRGLDRDTDSNPSKPLFIGEGVSSSVVITERGEQRIFYVSGKSEASSALLDMRLQRMMGHLPALVHPKPNSVLVVGFGAGVTAGSFVQYPEVQSIVICELEPMIPPASNEYFSKQNYGVLNDRRTRIVYDDARHYIATTHDKFDVITTDPIHPWVKGTSSLYSKEYFELVRRHLNPGGIAAQWLPLYESDEETVKSELATFFSVFPNGSAWGNYLNGDGYDMVLLGQTDPFPINVDVLERRLNQKAYTGVSGSLAEARINSAVDLLATYAGTASDLQPMLNGAQINKDLTMRLQYIAGIGLNSVTSQQIYRRILSYRKFPEGLLIGSCERIESLHELIGRPRRIF
jgi:spermidine synthase